MNSTFSQILCTECLNYFKLILGSENLKESNLVTCKNNKNLIMTCKIHRFCQNCFDFFKSTKKLLFSNCESKLCLNSSNYTETSSKPNELIKKI